MRESEFTFSETELRSVAARYNRTIDAFGPIERGYCNVSFAFKSNNLWYTVIVYLKSSMTAERIKQLHSYGSALAASGLPVRHPADARILCLRHEQWIRYAALYQYLPGQTIAWEGYTMKHIKLLGWALADTHRYSRNLIIPNLQSVENICLENINSMQQYFVSGVIDAMASKLKLQLDLQQITKFREFFKLLITLPERQILHMDFVRGNVLYDTAKPSDPWQLTQLALSGVLDLEKIGYGYPWIDIARTLAFLIADCSYKDPASIQRYFMGSGYYKRGQSQVKQQSVTLKSQTKCDILQTSLEFFWLFDFYKLLRANPYEHLEQNYHFRRTRDILLQRNLLHYI